jgi:dTDP-4-dehydrorhamnose 3,5-epimerase-like enzyme
MLKLIDLKTFTDDRGSLTVIEKVLPFPIKRLFYIYNNKNNLQRGGHKHKSAKMALIALSGSCKTTVQKGDETTSIALDTPSKC